LTRRGDGGGGGGGDMRLLAVWMDCKPEVVVRGWGSGRGTKGGVKEKGQKNYFKETDGTTTKKEAKENILPRDRKWEMEKVINQSQLAIHLSETRRK
jgi:hypothetical protein